MNLVQYRDDAGIIHVINAEQWKKQIGNTSDAFQNFLFEDIWQKKSENSEKSGIGRK